MPPKTSAKAIAAEIKKKNNLQANDIVAMMKRTAEQDKSSSQMASKTAIMERHFDSSTDVEMVKIRNSGGVANLPKKPEETSIAGSKKNNIDVANEVVLKKTARKDAISSAKTAKPAVKNDLNSIEIDLITNDESEVVRMTSDQAGSRSFGITEHEGGIPEKHNTRKSFAQKADQIATSSKRSDKGISSKPKYSSKRSKSGHGTGYQYEIDCEKVSDSIDVADLKRYLETQLKVNGQKNNFGSTVTISCEGKKVVIKSKVFLPKKSLRFLSKKFLKKNWNIRVASKNVHCYEYKYIVTL